MSDRRGHTPQHAHRPWQGIRAVLTAIGRVQMTILFWAAYLLIWMPAGLLTRLFADWLHRRQPAESNWWARPARLNDPSHVTQQS
jgi:hypothetical protein